MGRLSQGHRDLIDVPTGIYYESRDRKPGHRDFMDVPTGICYESWDRKPGEPIRPWGTGGQL